MRIESRGRGGVGAVGIASDSRGSESARGRDGCDLDAGGWGSGLGRAGDRGRAGGRAARFLDALIRARVVAVHVGARGVVVGDFDALDVHGEGRITEVGGTTGPGDGTLGLARCATGPVAELHAHGGLWVVLAAERERVRVRNGADDGAIDHKFEALRAPVDGVSVEGGLRGGDVVVDGAIVDGGVALAEEVGLDLSGVATEELPIDLVEIVRLQDDGANDTLAGGGHHGHVDAAEKDVEIGLDGRGLAVLVDGEFSTVCTVGECGAHRQTP